MSKLDMPYMASIVSIDPLSETILRISLKPEHYIPYQAGQYLQILSSEESLFYSIANAPLGAHQYEIHMRHHANHPAHQHLLTEIRTQGKVPLFLPLGNCHVGQFNRKTPTLLIAQGTGFAPMKAIIEQWLADEMMPPTVLCWIARTPEDWYLNDLVQHWLPVVPQLRYYPCLSETPLDELVKKLTLFAGFPLSELQVILAGPFDRMCNIRQEMIQAHPLNHLQFFSDAFET